MGIKKPNCALYRLWLSLLLAERATLDVPAGEVGADTASHIHNGGLDGLVRLPVIARKGNRAHQWSIAEELALLRHLNVIRVSQGTLRVGQSVFATLFGGSDLGDLELVALNTPCLVEKRILVHDRGRPCHLLDGKRSWESAAFIELCSILGNCP